MTIPELIYEVLGAIGRQFYADRLREFKRDERALSKAISRYGYECNYRGWEFSVSEILADLMKLLNEIKRCKVDIQYLPNYLEGAVTRHVGQRAEELSAKAKLSRPRVDRIVKATEGVQVVVQATNIEMMNAFYLHQKTMQKQKRAAKAKAAKLELQEELL